ncbi:MAG: glycosyltransferase [Cyanobacteria bacterium J06635_15]
MPRVSVVIPAYNALPYLPKTIDGVLQQTFQDYEILVVDDGSTDGTAEWLAQHNDPKLRVLSQPNQGCSTARNLGIAQATGDYIAFLDADDLWHPTKLEKQVRCLDGNPQVALVNTGITNIDQQGNPLKGDYLPNEADSNWPNILLENPIHCGSVPLVRRSCFEQLGDFDTHLKSAEDWDMWIRIAANFQIAALAEHLVYYRIHPGSKSHRLQFHLDSRIAVIEKAFSTVPDALLPLKSVALGRAYLSVAWKPLINDDYDTAMALRHQAGQHDLTLRSTQNYRRLGWIVTLRRLLGRSTYDAFLKLGRSLKQRLSLA